MKIEITKIKTTLAEAGLSDDKINEIINMLEESVTEDPQIDEDTAAPDADDLTDNSENLPKVKYEYVIILNDKEGYLKDKEIAGWVVQQEENADAGLITSRISTAVKDQNARAKRKKHAITDLMSAFEYLKPASLKSKNIKIKTKDLTRVIVSNGKLL